MIVHVKVQSILADTLGLSKADGPTELGISINSGTSLQGLFEQLTLQYAGFRSFTDPANNRLNDILMVVDGMVVVSTKLDQIILQDQSSVALYTRYKGG